MQQKKALEAIRQWREGDQDYQKGVALYQALSPNTILGAQLVRGESTFRARRLRQALEEVRVELQRQSRRETATYTEPATAAVDWPAMPPAMRKLQVELSEVFRDNQNDHHRLRRLKADEQRYQVQSAMLARERRRQQLWKYIDHWQAHGEMHVDLVEGPNDKGDRMRLRDYTRRMHNVPTYISRAKKAVKEAESDEARNEAEARLARYEEELAELKRLESFAWIITTPLSEPEPHAEET